MAPRSARQKAATRRMIAANRRGRSGGRRRRSSSRRSMRGSRRGGVKTEHLMEIPSKALIADGMLDGQGGPNFPRSGGVSPVSSALNGDFKGAVYNLKQNIPLIGKDPAHANNRATVGVGVVASPKTWRMASKIPVVGGIVRGIRRTLTIKDGRKRVALVG